MCGICGFIGEGGEGVLNEMNSVLAHRGPDAGGFFVDNKSEVFLGHRRLSILDIAGGVQPMVSDGKDFVIIFNGEIYNFQELQKDLKQDGYSFRTDHSDTEVILNSYRKWGEKCVQKFNGMWAFAIYDKKKQKLFISRDRFGKKPLFYTLIGNTFIFASELTALKKHPKCPTEISEISLIKYFAHQFIPAPNCILKNVFKLPAGHNLHFDIRNKSLQIVKYWDFVLEPFTKIPKNPEKVWGEKIRHLLEKAVQSRLVADVPVGVFLSGGVDSSAIAYYCKKHKPDLKSFSIGFDEASFDESEFSKKMSILLETQHFHKTFSVDDALEIIPEVLEKLDEPMGDSSILPTYLLAKMTREQVTVALSGDGGDEIFAGYAPFKALKMANIYDKIIPKGLHFFIKKLVYKIPVSHNYMSLDFKLKKTLAGLSHPWKYRNGAWMSTLEFSEIEDLFGKKLDPEEIYSEAISYWNDCPQENLIDKTLQFFIKTYLQDDILVKADRATMMHSLEARSPFLDVDLIDFARRIPAEYKLRNGTTKYILKKALEPILPHDILYRSKQGFAVPISKWFREGRINYTTDIDFLNDKEIKKITKTHNSGKFDRRLFLWCLKTY